MGSENRAHVQSLVESRSESKVLVGHKRSVVEVEGVSECSNKRVKMRDLDSVFRSEREGSNTACLDVNTNLLDLNVDAGSTIGVSGDETSSRLEECKDVHPKSRGFNLDLNVTDIPNSNDPFYPYKNYEYMKSRDDSECGSSVSPLDKKDSMKVWKGLKQNNYMSLSHGYAPIPEPKLRARKKTKNDFAKKIELAKKEQVDRFARVAAPSGLLNGLNPGIINHVRNSKQVHSIIEALVRSARSENGHSRSKQDNHTQELNEKKELNAVSGSGDISLGRRHMIENSLMSNPKITKNEVGGVSDDSRDRKARTFFRMSEQRLMENGNYNLGLKLSSSATAPSENASCLTNEESENVTSVNSLSIKAANVASQWLELLNHDIRGRIAALRRSRKRVRAVITTELPHLILREFPPHLEKSAVDAHTVRWSNLFTQMDKTLSEEESSLENWLNQIKEMQLHCEKGLHRTYLYHHGSQQTSSMGNNIRSEADDSDKDLAVRAAAASMYSTCNFLFSMENQPFS